MTEKESEIAQALAESPEELVVPVEPPIVEVPPPQSVESGGIEQLGVYSRTSNLPEFGSDWSSGADVRADFSESKTVKRFGADNRESPLKINSRGELHIAPGERVLVPTGLFLDIPENFEVQVLPRSGMSLKSGLMVANSPGLIDADYINELFVIMVNVSHRTVVIEDGDRVAQIKLAPRTRFKINKMSRAARQKTNRTGGIGSTGVK